MSTTNQYIQEVQEGQVASFAHLVNEHKNLVYSVLLRMVKNNQDAEELAQDTFVKAFKSIKQFKGDAKFSTWIYKIAYFTGINYLRKNSLLTSPIILENIESEDSTAIESLNKTDQAAYLEQALNYLRPIDKSLITLYYFEDLSVKEISEITTFSVQNVKVKMLRIRKQLNGILKHLLNDEIDQLLKD